MGLKTFVLLNHLHEDVDVSQRQLGDHMCLPANNLVLLLNEVERAGWAARRRDPADRRRHLVRRTTAGTAALIRAERAMDSVEDQVLDHLTPQQRAALHALLSRTIDE
jgi:DNA-binding MarR family transcriptional regulator